MEMKEDPMERPPENGSSYKRQMAFSDDDSSELARKQLKRKHLVIANAADASPRIRTISVPEINLSEAMAKRIKKAKKQKKKRLSLEAASGLDSHIGSCSTSSKRGHRKKRNHVKEADDAVPFKPLLLLEGSNVTSISVTSTPRLNLVVPLTSPSTTTNSTMTPTRRLREPIYAPVVDGKPSTTNLINDYRRFSGGSETCPPVRRVFRDSLRHPPHFSFVSVGATQTAKRLKAADGRFITCFFTKVYVFSNHFSRPALFEVDGVKYLCSEQYYMYYKARVFGDMDTAGNIMNATTPREIKRMGTRVRNFDLEKWRKIAIQVMVIASLAKYEQNADLRFQLFATAGSTLVETNPNDCYWGVGLLMHDPAVRQPALWPGQNVLGRLLTMLRERLMTRDEFCTEASEAKATARLSPASKRNDGAHAKHHDAEEVEMDITSTQRSSPQMSPAQRQQSKCQRNQLDLVGFMWSYDSEIEEED